MADPCDAISGLAEDYGLRQTADSLIEWILDSVLIDGMLVNDVVDRTKHMLQVELVPFAPGSSIPDATLFEAVLPESVLWQFRLIADEDLTTFYCFQGREPPVVLGLGDELPFRSSYFIWAADPDEHVVWISYASIHLQVRAVNALLKLYEATTARSYLEIAHRILMGLIGRAEPDGRFYIVYADQEELTYKGRIQALVMYELWNYFQYDKDDQIAEALVDLAETFEHTTERTINHRTSSNIGQLIANIVLKAPRFDESKIRAELLDTLDTYEDDGNLPKTTRNSANYPYYEPSYLSYDAMLLLRASQFVLGDEIYEKVFPLAFEKSVETSNRALYLGRNLYTLYYALKLHGHVDPRVATWIESSTNIWRAPRDVWDALEMLEITAGYLALSSLCERR